MKRRTLVLLSCALAGAVSGADEICGAPRVQTRAEIIWTKPPLQGAGPLHRLAYRVPREELLALTLS